MGFSISQAGYSPFTVRAEEGGPQERPSRSTGRRLPFETRALPAPQGERILFR